MPITPIDKVLFTRQLARTDERGGATSASLIVGEPLKHADAAIGFDGYRCTIHLQGLRPECPPVDDVIGVDAVSIDALDALLQALFSARAVLDASPAGRAGHLVWSDAPRAPGCGLPKKIIELSDWLRASYAHMNPSERGFWDGLLAGVPLTKEAMVREPEHELDWQALLAAPVSALRSVSAADAELLAQLHIHTIGELAASMPFRVADAIARAANPRNPIVD
jgi:hypothetical protein